MMGLCAVATVLVSVVPITPVSAGLGGSTNYDVTAIAANGFPRDGDTTDQMTGTHFAGGLADLSRSDDKFFEVESEFAPGIGYWASIRADFVIAEPASTVTELEFTVEIHATEGSTSGARLWAFNWTAKKYEYVKSFRVRPSGNEQTLIKIKKTPGNYVSPGRSVRIAIRVDGPSHHAKPEQFRMRTDLVRLNVKKMWRD